MKAKVEKFFDEVKMAASGIVLATRRWQLWAVFVPVFLVFGTLLSMLSAGMGAMNLFFASNVPDKFQIIGDAFLGFFGKDKYFLDFLQNFLIALLQAILIALIVFVIRGRKKSVKERVKSSSEAGSKAAGSSSSAEIQNAGLAAALALLGSGCPTCGTTLITPILISIFSTSGYALAGAISGLITFFAVILLLWSLKRVGLEAYAIIIDEKWRKKVEKK
ncbi:hypothetical protein IJI64_02620 [Candidatus Saccharibacteria bacterium]|nr:hypothetical protein [Candidatus Saccharibacteria bacterium]